MTFEFLYSLFINDIGNLLKLFYTSDSFILLKNFEPCVLIGRTCQIWVGKA